ncbi:MAG: hypothetical protein ABSF51_14165 [Verrucomicrobiota bacterium]
MPTRSTKIPGMQGTFRNPSRHLIGGLEMQGRLHPAGIPRGSKTID